MQVQGKAYTRFIFEAHHPIHIDHSAISIKAATIVGSAPFHCSSSTARVVALLPQLPVQSNHAVMHRTSALCRKFRAPLTFCRTSACTRQSCAPSRFAHYGPRQQPAVPRGGNTYCSTALETAMRTQPPQLITFDVDGTLLKALGPKGNAAHIAAVDAAVKAVYGIDVSVHDVPHKGSTDMAIMRAMCEKAGVTQQVINDNLAQALADAAQRIDHFISPDDTTLVLPGVVQLLDTLKSRGVALALATGNIERIAWKKLAAARLDHYFSTGGFGSDAENRTDIVRKAIERSGAIERSLVVHVGDAEADVASAQQLGIGGIGVLTGAFNRRQLEAKHPLTVFDDFTDTTAFLKVVGFSQ